jgi:hypothetical protein
MGLGGRDLGLQVRACVRNRGGALNSRDMFHHTLNSPCKTAEKNLPAAVPG